MTPSRQRILMCSPDFYGVEYVINPWMQGQEGHTDRALARKQWEGLHAEIARDAEVALVAPHEHLPDMVFTANAGMVKGKTAILSRFRAPERQGEEPYFRAWFEENGFAIAPWPEGVAFEGAGDALFDRGQALTWCGYGFRSDETAARLIEKTFDREAVPLRLVDPRFYHLDTCLCPLAGGWLMYYPPAFDARSLQTIRARVAMERRIEVGAADAMQFACNAVDLAGRVILNHATPELQACLRAAGFTPVITPLGEFLKAGGTAKCLTLKLVEP